MKKLGKLSINPEKVFSNKELANLKGGYWICHCHNPPHNPTYIESFPDGMNVVIWIEQNCTDGQGTCRQY